MDSRKFIAQNLCFSMNIFTYFTSGQTTIPNLYVNTGHGSKGWTLTFGSIKLLADLISQTKPEVNLK